MDGFIRQASGESGCGADKTNPACATGTAREVMGYHTGSDIPNYWTYARDFVLQDHMFEPNVSWSLPSHLFLVSEWSAYCTAEGNPSGCVNANGLQVRPARPVAAPAFYGGEAGPQASEEGQDGGECRPAYLRLDRSDLPAAQVPRQLGLLHLQRHRAGLREPSGYVLCAHGAERQHARDLEPAPVVRHGQGRQPARELPVS
jgi:hypothetical protein